MGTIYLLHFERKLAHAQHYLGYTEDLADRLERHRAGNGARLLEVITEHGITWTVARTWAGGRDLERRLKRQKNAPTRLCPICKREEVMTGERTTLLALGPTLAPDTAEVETNFGGAGRGHGH